MKKTLLAALLAGAALNVNAELIQHTDQIAEVKFTGSTYELGKHVGEVGYDQIHDAIGRFNDTLGVMLDGLNVASLGKGFESSGVFEKLQKDSPDAAAYIQGLSESLNLPPSFLLAVGMSDEAILESQANGGVGFLQSEPPARCTVMGRSNGKGKAWAAANFDYMGVNYEGLIVLNHTDVDGKNRIIQTWAGLIPYGGISKGGKVVLMNTLADEGKSREMDKGEIIANDAMPSYHLSWDVYNTISKQEVMDMYDHRKFTAYFAYTIVDANGRLLQVENGYPAALYTKTGNAFAHTNHSVFDHKPFVDNDFGAKSLYRYSDALKFVNNTNENVTESEALDVLRSHNIWKGRGEMMGTVTSTYFAIDGKNVDMAIYTDKDSAPVRVRNY